MSSAGTQSLAVSLPARTTVPFLEGTAVSIPWWRALQSVVAAVNAIPDTATIAEIEAELASLATRVTAAEQLATAAEALAKQAISQADNTLAYVGLARLDGSAA